MAALNGKWKLVNAEKFKEYLDALGKLIKYWSKIENKNIYKHKDCNYTDCLGNECLQEIAFTF